MASSLLLFLLGCNNDEKVDHTQHNKADTKKEWVKKEMDTVLTTGVQLEYLDQLQQLLTIQVELERILEIK